MCWEMNGACLPPPVAFSGLCSRVITSAPATKNPSQASSSSRILWAPIPAWGIGGWLPLTKTTPTLYSLTHWEKTRNGNEDTRYIVWTQLKSNDFNSIHSSYHMFGTTLGRKSTDRKNRPLPSRAHRLAESEFGNLSLSSLRSFRAYYVTGTGDPRNKKDAIQASSLHSNGRGK